MNYRRLIAALTDALNEHDPVLAAEIREGYDSIYQMLEDGYEGYANASGMEAIYWLIDQLLNGLPSNTELTIRVPVSA